MVKSFSIRALLALLLGLVLQVGLAAPTLARVPVSSCAMGSACGCCAKKASCDCVTDSTGQETPPAPATVPERPVAVPVAAPPATLGLAGNDFPVETASGFHRPDAHRAGFPGVSLAVVFCRWVI